MVTILFIFLNFVFPFWMCIVLNEAKIWMSDVKRDTELSILCYTRLVPYYLVAGQKQNVMWKTAEVFFVHSDEACYENICKEYVFEWGLVNMHLLRNQKWNICLSYTRIHQLIILTSTTSLGFASKWRYSVNAKTKVFH